VTETSTPTLERPSAGEDVSYGSDRRSFRSMGTVVTVIGPPPASPGERVALDRAAREVERVFVREDERFSRFRHATEISAVNARAGKWTRVSRPFLEVLSLSLEAAGLTGGLFDPTVLPALLAIGYDRDFDDVIAGARLACNPPEPCGRWDEIEIRDREIRIPADIAVDFGGIAKGWTVDVAARRIKGLLRWSVIDAGGDLLVKGRPPAPGLSIGVEDPDDPETEVLRLNLDRGALATSSVRLRSWGPKLHHLIDPRTGAPADTGVVQATVWAATCVAAEVGAKWALLGGPRVLESVAAVLVQADGSVVTNMVDHRPEHSEISEGAHEPWPT
jgi:thiamine biosynthesis lipoprotein